MSELRLHSFFRSSASWRVRIALNIKGLSYKTMPVNIRAGAHREAPYIYTNPGKLVPALEIDGRVISQSLAIIEYIEETHPTPALLPADPYERARVRAVAQHIASEIHPLNNLRVLGYLKSNLQVPDTTDWYRHWITEGFQAVEELVEGPDYCFGGGVSLADVALAPQVGNAVRFNVDLERFPKLTRINCHLEALDVFRAAAPEAQPDRV
jgi:maleylacetoacetate isomerase